uniref:Uncharacterized protein n=1 Tax=Pogona vitticeps TaxID=103695 RepID=A0ABM5GQ97_9SAUR
MEEQKKSVEERKMAEAALEELIRTQKLSQEERQRVEKKAVEERERIQREQEQIRANALEQQERAHLAMEELAKAQKAALGEHEKAQKKALEEQKRAQRAMEELEKVRKQALEEMEKAQTKHPAPSQESVLKKFNEACKMVHSIGTNEPEGTPKKEPDAVHKQTGAEPGNTHNDLEQKEYPQPHKSTGHRGSERPFLTSVLDFFQTEYIPEF